MQKIKHFLLKHRLSATFFGTLIVILAVGWFFLWPLGPVVETPGEAINIQPMVKIKNKKPLKKTEFMITAVSIAPARPVSYVHKLFDPHMTIENKKDVMGDQNSSQFDNVQDVYMKSAINNATYVGYHEANYPAKRHYHGVFVLDILPGSNFKHKLQPADLVESVNGKRMSQATEYQKYIKALPKHAKLTIAYKRHGKNHVAKGEKRKISNGFSGIGITMTDDMTLKTNPTAKIKPGDIGGPSGGLMFALQVYSQLKNPSYKYTKVAGTGTIAPNGQVGEIGGVDKKIIAAHKSGAQIFLCPYLKPTKTILSIEPGHKTNYQLAKQTAKKYAPGMKVVPVASFKQALRALNK